MRISRRAILAASAAAPFISRAVRAANAASIDLDPQTRLGTLPANFIGLGFETSSVAVPGLLSAGNHAYVRLVRNLGRQGVIRIGGNTSDFASYSATGAAVSQPKATVVNAASLRQLRSFLDATGWSLIWGLDLGQNNLGNIVEEARAVANAAGDRLLALQIGNEPDLFVQAGHRQGVYDYAAWHAEYRRIKAAVRAAVPQARFAGPDVAGAADWLSDFAHDEGGDLALLTAHHYMGDQASPASTIARMLQPETGFRPTLAKFQAAARAAGVPYRISETGSFYGGGKAGVSDTFAAALWVLDYLFVLAGFDCSGVNIETGVNHLGRLSYYTPIRDDLAGYYGAAPEYYGLLAFAQMATGTRIATRCDPGDINLTAYGMQDGVGAVSLAVINKDLSWDVTVAVTAPAALKQAHALRLTAPAISSKDGVTLGGAAVTADGYWTGSRPERVKIADGKATLDVPAASVALVTLNL